MDLNKQRTAAEWSSLSSRLISARDLARTESRRARAQNASLRSQVATLLSFVPPANRQAVLALIEKDEVPPHPRAMGLADSGFMCKVDFDCELGAAAGGVLVYPSLADLRKHRSCVVECGIIEVKVAFLGVVQEPDYSNLLKPVTSDTA
jgi:hypothetical protein